MTHRRDEVVFLPVEIPQLVDEVSFVLEGFLVGQLGLVSLRDVHELGGDDALVERPVAGAEKVLDSLAEAGRQLATLLQLPATAIRVEDLNGRIPAR